MKTLDSANVFILTGEWHDIKGKNVLFFYGTSEECGPVEIIYDKAKPVFFIDHQTELPEFKTAFLRKESKLKSFQDQLVDVIYFNNQRNLLNTAGLLREKNIATFESDVDPVRRFLMERFINAQMHIEGKALNKDNLVTFFNPTVKTAELNPRFKIASLDIETGVKNRMLYSVATHITGAAEEDKKVFILGEAPKKNYPEHLTFCPSEELLLTEFISWFKNVDPDIIIGWHVIGFDLMFLEKKCNDVNISFDLGRGRNRVTLRSGQSGRYYAFIPGRVVVDGPVSLRAGFYSFEDYKLETVAQEVLGTGKTISPEQNKVQEIERLFKEDKIKLAEYNLTDAELVSSIFEKTGLIELSVKRSQLSGLMIDHLGMMTAAFDHFYLPKIHRYGYVAPNIKDISSMQHSAGGYVIDPSPGIFNDVVVLDFKSLYPSIIQTFKIDPLSRLKQDVDTIRTPSGYKFSSTQNFLPDFINTLIQQRAEAKKKNDKQLSQAIKILMNSFYGVMGAYNCRFYHPDLPSAITGTGQWLLLNSKEFLERNGYEIVYGDTDSLFVKLNEGEGKDATIVGENLASSLNAYWREKLLKDFELNSYLEIEYEKFYKKFIITPARGSETGAKKRYAGLLIEDDKEKLEFVGMEFVRSDWTKLAKEFQVELYERVFNNKDIKDWIRSVVAKVNKGELDNMLIYKKRLRKNIERYTKNIPPQVKAARMIGSKVSTVYYVITKRGPIPIELDHSDIDYKHYIEKQLKPVADSVLTLLGESFDSIVNSTQLNFFEDLK